MNNNFPYFRKSILQERGNQLLEEAIEMVRSVVDVGNIERDIVLNTRAKMRWGLCSYNKKDDIFKIEINKELLERDEKASLETLVHEVLHTVDGCLNHGHKWKLYAGMVGIKFGISISTTTPYNLIEKDSYKYILQCRKCNQEYFYLRMCKSVKHYTSVRCGNLGCKGKLDRVK